MITYTADLLLAAENELGEGPIWHPVHEKLYWVDITQGKVQAYDPATQKVEHWPFPGFACALGVDQGDAIFVVEGSQLSRLHTQSGEVETLFELSIGEKRRFNECKLDRQGRFWMGTMHLDAKENAGAFYRLDQDGTFTKILDNQTIPNGFCWSADEQYLFHIDSFRHQVNCYVYDAAAGMISDPITIYTNPDPNVYLDGMCMDQAGNLWIACWGNGKVISVDPVRREVMAEVSVPAPHVTSCVWGGADGATLYITTARLGLTEEQLAEYPLSGGVFRVKV
ncbi:MAG: SMP-30/gluconolactonase/LRE family protein [Bacteroidota bacterium]